LDGAAQFFREGKLPGALNEESFVQGWRQMLTSGVGVLLGAFSERGIEGAIGGSVFPDFPTGDLVATEFFWFTIPGHRGSGLKLLTAFENECRSRGAKRINMVHLVNLNDDIMARVYERRGYDLREKIYIKNL
jgi:GNAT superfamily N-acetyltransferase